MINGTEPPIMRQSGHCAKCLY